MSGIYRFAFEPSGALPPLAWIAEVEGVHVRVRCGTSVRCEPAGFVEGTWVGSPDIGLLPKSTAVFGSGMVADDGGLVVVPPSHPLERIYLYIDPTAGRAARRIVSNSLVAVFDAAQLESDSDALYPPIFIAAADGLRDATIDIPTNRNPIVAAVYYNVRLLSDGGLALEDRPRERPFTSFADFRDRLSEALASAVANAPGYEMAIAISSGYDSTAVAAIAAPLGCRRALTFTVGKPVSGSSSLVDSGEPQARRLGMTVESFDRLDYTRRTDLPEAEFLATGMSGEDVVMVAMEGALGRALLLTGSEEFHLKGNPYRPGMYRGDLSACSLTEFRLRTDFIHLPLLFFGATEHPSVMDVIHSPEMQPFSVPGPYDKPIQRRLAEEAGITRGTFATVKRRASGRIHADGLAAMAPDSAAAVTRFARAEGREPSFRKRFRMKRRHRLAIRLARRLRLERLAAPLTRRRRSLIHSEPVLGSLLFRWAVSVVRPRYADARSDIIRRC